MKIILGLLILISQVAEAQGIKTPDMAKPQSFKGRVEGSKREVHMLLSPLPYCEPCAIATIVEMSRGKPQNVDVYLMKPGGRIPYTLTPLKVSKVDGDIGDENATYSHVIAIEYPNVLSNPLQICAQRTSKRVSFTVKLANSQAAEPGRVSIGHTMKFEGDCASEEIVASKNGKYRNANFPFESQFSIVPADENGEAIVSLPGMAGLVVLRERLPGVYSLQPFNVDEKGETVGQWPTAMGVFIKNNTLFGKEHNLIVFNAFGPSNVRVYRRDLIQPKEARQ